MNLKRFLDHCVFARLLSANHRLLAQFWCYSTRKKEVDCGCQGSQTDLIRITVLLLCWLCLDSKSLSNISGVYIIVVMGLSSLSVVFAVVVGYIHHQGLMDREVPDWLRKLGRKINKIVLVHPRRKIGSQKGDSSTADTTPEPKQSFNGSFTSLNLTFKNDMNVDHTPNHKPVINKALSQQTYVTRDGNLKLANSTREGMRLARSGPGTGFRLNQNHSPAVNTPLLAASGPDKGGGREGGAGGNNEKHNVYNSTKTAGNPDATCAANSNSKSLKEKCPNKDIVQNSPKAIKNKDTAQGSSKVYHHSTKDTMPNNPKDNSTEGGNQARKPNASKEPVQNSPKTNHNKPVRKDKQIKTGSEVDKHENIPLLPRESRECHECKLFKQARLEALQGCQSTNPQPAAPENHPSEACSEKAHSKECNRSKKRCERHYAQQEEILKRLSTLLLKQEELMKPPPEEVNKEWHEIAEVADRCFFWFYLTITLLVTIIILLLVPLGKSATLQTDIIS